jgi:hypothetical protein
MDSCDHSANSLFPPLHVHLMIRLSLCLIKRHRAWKAKLDGLETLMCVTSVTISSIMSGASHSSASRLTSAYAQPPPMGYPRQRPCHFPCGHLAPIRGFAQSFIDLPGHDETPLRPRRCALRQRRGLGTLGSPRLQIDDGAAGQRHFAGEHRGGCSSARWPGQRRKCPTIPAAPPTGPHHGSCGAVVEMERHPGQIFPKMRLIRANVTRPAA